MEETRKRSILKAVIWRVLATLTTMMVVFVFTGNIILSIEVGFVEAVAKMIIYYLHERGWDKIGWGRNHGA